MSDIYISEDISFHLNESEIFELLNVKKFMRKLKEFDEDEQKKEEEEARIEEERSRLQSEPKNNLDASLGCTSANGSPLNSTSSSESPYFEYSFDFSQILADYSLLDTTESGTASSVELMKKVFGDLFQRVFPIAMQPIREKLSILNLNSEKLTKMVDLEPEMKPLGVWIPTYLLPSTEKPSRTEMASSVFTTGTSEAIDKALENDQPPSSQVSIKPATSTGDYCFDSRPHHNRKVGHGKRWFVSLEELTNAETHCDADIRKLMEWVFGGHYVQNYFYSTSFPSDLDTAINQLLGKMVYKR